MFCKTNLGRWDKVKIFRRERALLQEHFINKLQPVKVARTTACEMRDDHLAHNLSSTNVFMHTKLPARIISMRNICDFICIYLAAYIEALYRDILRQWSWKLRQVPPSPSCFSKRGDHESYQSTARNTTQMRFPVEFSRRNCGWSLSPRRCRGRCVRRPRLYLPSRFICATCYTAKRRTAIRAREREIFIILRDVILSSVNMIHIIYITYTKRNKKRIITTKKKKKVNSVLYKSRLCEYLPMSIRVRLVVTLIQPIIDYCCAPFMDITACQDIRLVRSFNACLTFIFTLRREICT